MAEVKICFGFRMMKTVWDQLDIKNDVGSTGWFLTLATIMFFSQMMYRFFYSILLSQMACKIVHIAAVNGEKNLPGLSPKVYNVWLCPYTQPGEYSTVYLRKKQLSSYICQSSDRRQNNVNLLVAVGAFFIPPLKTDTTRCVKSLLKASVNIFAEKVLGFMSC